MNKPEVINPMIGRKKMKIMLLIVWINQKLLILWLKILLKNDEDNPIYNMNKSDIVDSMLWIKREIVDSMVGSVVKKDEEENSINSMNKGEIVDSLVNEEENISGSVIKEGDKLIGDLNNQEIVDSQKINVNNVRIQSVKMWEDDSLDDTFKIEEIFS